MSPAATVPLAAPMVLPEAPRLQSPGAWAALFMAMAYVVGFASMATWLNPPDAQAGAGPAAALAFVLERKLWFQLWMILIYVLAGGALVVLSVALHERLKPSSPDAMQLATPFGLIWAGLVMASGMVAITGLESAAALRDRSADLALMAWISTDVLQNGLGGGIEIVGGVWMLLVSAAARRTAAFRPWLIYGGALVGVVGIATVLPPLKDLVEVFGLAQIAWFAGVGAAMLRSPSVLSR